MPHAPWLRAALRSCVYNQALSAALAGAACMGALPSAAYGADLAMAVLPSARSAQLTNHAPTSLTVFAGPFDASMTFTIAKASMLAAAQRNIAENMTSAMDMSLCGDGVSLLTAWWSTELTRRDLAILATAGGIRLEGHLRSLAEMPLLPAGIAIEYYRLTK